MTTIPRPIDTLTAVVIRPSEAWDELQSLRHQLAQAQAERDAAVKANGDERGAWSRVYAILTGTEYGEGYSLKDLTQSAETIVDERDNYQRMFNEYLKIEGQLRASLPTPALEAARAQMERDCQAVCNLCQDHASGVEGVGVAEKLGMVWIHYLIFPSGTRSVADCGAMRIRSAYALSAAGMGKEKKQ